MKKRIAIIMGCILILILILILLPDSFYQKHSKYGWFYESDMFNKGEDEKAGWGISLEEQFNKLLNNKYEYNYKLEYGYPNKDKVVVNKYTCSGKKDEDNDNGSCTIVLCSGDKDKGQDGLSCSSEKELDYTNDNFKEVFNNVNSSYLDVNYIYDLIKDKDNTFNQYSETRMFEYHVVSNNTDTDIYVYTNEDDIYKIMIMNGYLTYEIEYNNIRG